MKQSKSKKELGDEERVKTMCQVHPLRVTKTLSKESFKQDKYDTLYMDIAERIAQMSHCNLAKVGAVLVKDNNIISFGWNGTPTGFDNCCEEVLEDGTTDTKRNVVHAEQNVFSKLAKNGGVGANGATLYCTLSPCYNCVKLIIQSGISRVVYKNDHYDLTPLNFLKEACITLDKMEN